MTSSTVVPIGLKLRMDERMKMALDAMPIAVSWVRLDDGRIEFTNRRFVDMFGYDATDFPDLFGMLAATFADPAQLEVANAAMRRVIGQDLLRGFEFPPEEVPVKTRDGRRLITSFSGVILPDANMSLATFVDISALKKQEAQLHRLATKDALTGLLNRWSFDDAMDKAVARGDPFAVVVLDLDGFKAVNDSLGHDAGDEVLRHFGSVLRGAVRSGDLVCRWGGDEFAVLLPAPLSPDDVSGVMSRLAKRLEHPIELRGSTLTCGASAGSARFPEDGKTSLELWRVADRRMFEDKKRPGHHTR